MIFISPEDCTRLFNSTSPPDVLAILTEPFVFVILFRTTSACVFELFVILTPLFALRVPVTTSPEAVASFVILICPPVA